MEPPTTATNKLLERLNLVSRRGDSEEIIDDYYEPEEHEPKPEPVNIGVRSFTIDPEPEDSGVRSFSHNIAPKLQFSPLEPIKFDISEDKPVPEIRIEGIKNKEKSAKSSLNVKKKCAEPLLPGSEAIDPICIKFGSNEHPLLKYWLIVLSLTGAPVFFFTVGRFSRLKKLWKFLSLIFPFTLLVIYHALFVLSAANILEKAGTDEKDKEYYTIWLEFYPLVFNLAVIVVNDVMWTIGLANGCWMSDVLQSFKELPPAKEVLTEIQYNYFGSEHWIYVNGNKYRCGSSATKSKLKLRTDMLWQIINFGVRQIAAFGCSFTYLHVHYKYYSLRTAEKDIFFVLEIINIVLTCSSWLAILWTYMTLCQVLQWRFQHLNDWIWHFKRQRKLPTMREFHIMKATYQSYIDRVSIVDDYFKYWIFGVFGVLFFQVTIYFQYVIFTFENRPPSFSFLVIPLITIPFISALLLLIKRAASVNAESKIPDEIIVQICLNTRSSIPDNLYKKMKFFMWLVSEGSSLTIFGLVDITKEFMGTAIAVIFSFTFLLHEFTPKDSPCDILAKNLTERLN